MLCMLVRFTHQVAVCLPYADKTHCPSLYVWFAFSPSTALLDANLSSKSTAGFSWWVGLLRATLTIYIYICVCVTYLNIVYIEVLFSINSRLKLYFIVNTNMFLIVIIIIPISLLTFHFVSLLTLQRYICNTFHYKIEKIANLA